MTRLTVSFCVPTHGRSRLLVEALESGINQTRLPDEIVVSDDLGSEDSRAIVSDFARRTAVPVRYLHCTTGPGQAENLNHCVREAAGDLLLVLHDDDLLMPCAIEKLALPFEENPAIVGAYGKQLFIRESGADNPEHTANMNRDFRRNAKYAGVQKDAVLAGAWQQFPNDGYMVKATVAREVLYRAQCRAGADFDFGVRMGERGLFYYIDEYTAKYRESAESVGRGAGKKSDDSAYQGMHILARTLKAHPQYEAELVAVMKNLSPMSIRMAANTGHVDEAIPWYFGQYHRHHILSPAGLKTGFILAKTWLAEKAGGK